MILDAHGLRIELPAHWTGRLFSRSRGLATLHAGDFQLALKDGEFGTSSTGRMPSVASFIALTEYAPGPGLSPGSGLFGPSRIDLPLDPATFAATKLARPRTGQAGMQHFFTTAGRPFCLYVVLAGGRHVRRRQLAVIDHALRSLRIQPR